MNKEVEVADAAIVTIGRQAGEGVDRDIATEFNLIDEERQLIFDVCNIFHAAGKPVIVIINSGSVIETASWNQYPDAILCAWQPGEEGGNSIADILTGKVNPSGKLTMTWPVAAADHPSTKNFPGLVDFYSYEVAKSSGREIPGYDYTNHEEDIYVGYRFFDTFGRDVAYPFGFGLSYTTFDYAKPTVKVSGDNVVVSVTVKNSGKVSGKEVVQVYVAAPQGRISKPAKELKAFAKTRLLNPGESQTVTMTIPKRMLASFDEDASQWLAEAGSYQVMIGASIADIRAHAAFSLPKAYTEKTSDALRPKHQLNLLRK
jgi:beta-glucosidase